MRCSYKYWCFNAAGRDNGDHVLENQPREEVATVADLSGTLDDPDTSTWEIVVRLVSNAFVKAILPGFEREIEAARDRD